MAPQQGFALNAEAARVLRFLAAGGAAAVANLGSRFLFSRVLPFELAVVAAYCVGMAVAFVLMRRYAFAASQRALGAQAATFVVVNALGLLQTVVISSLLARWLLPRLGIGDGAQAIAHGVGVAVPVVTSYFGHRWGSFR